MGCGTFATRHLRHVAPSARPRGVARFLVPDVTFARRAPPHPTRPSGHRRTHLRSNFVSGLAAPLDPDALECKKWNGVVARPKIERRPTADGHARPRLVSRPHRAECGTTTRRADALAAVPRWSRAPRPPFSLCLPAPPTVPVGLTLWMCDGCGEVVVWPTDGARTNERAVESVDRPNRSDGREGGRTGNRSPRKGWVNSPRSIVGEQKY